ncbi:DUF5590 domain-containing protein [Virgibacillus doumboii]|uniref:cell wall elongation regulator TseB-like domain-containing protein n=1 Tax=Virgibacillus doumboii TaxID=2697503 RepID=UPI0013E023B2|nr:DUF5590 domain-containing protein [Virgibacillus doumboii]
MKLKWIIGIVCLFLVSCFIYGVFLYNDIQKDKTASFNRVKEAVIQETELTEIGKVERFHGKKAYYILHGKTKNNEEKIVFYPFKAENKDLTIISKSDIVPEETIRNNWRGKCKNCEMHEIAPAIVTDDNDPAWELTYTDESNRFVIDYLSIYDGSRIEMIGFRRMFK